jgi:hypothetical protein
MIMHLYVHVKYICRETVMKYVPRATILYSTVQCSVLSTARRTVVIVMDQMEIERCHVT